MTSVGSYSPGPDMVGRWVYLEQKRMKGRREAERRRKEGDRMERIRERRYEEGRYIIAKYNTYSHVNNSENINTIEDNRIHAYIIVETG